MTINYTPLLSLAEPVTGTQSGTWGDDVNQGLTDYLDIAIAGAQVISGSQTAVTLSKTTGSSAGSNIAQVGGAGTTGSSQYAVINCTGNPASMLTITAPATSKTYVVINSTSTSQSVKLVGTGPTTGVTVATGQAALVAWKGADFTLVATTDVSKLTGTLGVANGGTGATTLTGLLLGNGTSAVTTVTAPSGTVVGTTDTQTLTNKRVTPRVVSITSSATITPAGDTADQYNVTSLATPATIAAPSGTPTDGQKLILRLKDDGTSRVLTWTTTSGAYRLVGTAFPAATVANKVLYIGCIYNSQATYWDVVSVVVQS